MSLSQVQIIQSLAEALAWFEKELGWKVEAAELRHLTGRIGELYAAMITRGQIALAVTSVVMTSWVLTAGALRLRR